MPQQLDPGEVPTVALTAFEFLRAATGHPIRCRTLHGRDVLVRLYTPDEFLQAVTEAREGVPADQLPPMPTREDAEGLCAPLAVEG
jgi:hypothetical protein